MNSPRAAAAAGAAAAKWAALIAFSTCFIYQSAQYAALSCCPTFFFPRFSRLKMEAAVWRGAVGFFWLLLGSGGSGLLASLPWAAVSRWHRPECHAAVTQLPPCRAERSLAARGRTALCEWPFPRAGNAFKEQPGFWSSFCALPRAAVSQADARRRRRLLSCLRAWQGLAVTWPWPNCVTNWPILVPARFPPSPPAACARGGEEGAAGCVPAASLLINKPR